MLRPDVLATCSKCCSIMFSSREIVHAMAISNHDSVDSATKSIARPTIRYITQSNI
jgi:hypothetical protein